MKIKIFYYYVYCSDESEIFERIFTGKNIQECVKNIIKYFMALSECEIEISKIEIVEE